LKSGYAQWATGIRAVMKAALKLHTVSAASIRNNFGFPKV
jgi:hypothetical protein